MSYEDRKKEAIEKAEKEIFKLCQELKVPFSAVLYGIGDYNVRFR